MLTAQTHWFPNPPADFPERPTADIGQYPMIGRFVRDAKNPKYSKYMTHFYDLYNEVDQLVGTVNDYKRIGDMKSAMEFDRKHRDKLSMRDKLGRVRQRLGKIRTEIHEVWFSRQMDGDEKRKRINELTSERNRIVKEVYNEYIIKRRK
jgi:hypothetical protein